MSDVTLVSNPEDAAALAAAEEHHAHLAGALAGRVALLQQAADRADVAGAESIRVDLVAFCDNELLPHAFAEEASVYGDAHKLAEGKLLIDSLIGEHNRIKVMVDALRTAGTPADTAAEARALQVFFESHKDKEEDLVLPLLAAKGASLKGVLGHLHEEFEKAQPEGAHAGHGHGHGHGGCGCGGHGEGHGHGGGHGHGHGGCTCGEEDEELPELDARTVPHAIRHATVFGALEAVPAGKAMVLVAPHDPLPLLAQIEQRYPGVFEVTYLERGPEAWRLQLSHR